MKTFSANARRYGMLLAVPAALATLVAIAGIHSNSEKPAAAAAKENSASEESSVTFNKEGELERPTGYRKWTYVGTPLTPNDLNEESSRLASRQWFFGLLLQRPQAVEAPRH